MLADYGAAHDTAGLAEQRPRLRAVARPRATRPTAVNGALAARPGQPRRRSTSTCAAILRTLFAFGFFDRDAFTRRRRADRQARPRARPRSASRSRRSRCCATSAARCRSTRSKLQVASRSSAPTPTTFKTGGGSGNVTPFAVTTPREAITKRARHGVPGHLRRRAATPTRAAAPRARPPTSRSSSPRDYQTEGNDRALPDARVPAAYNGDQDALIEEVAAANPHTVVVLETGGPVLTPWRDKVAALVEAWYPGQEGGTAIARVLFGDVDPGGRLPATFPRSEADLPTAGDPEKYPGVGEQRHLQGGRARRLPLVRRERSSSPRIPFGFGLSYTTFASRGLRVTPGRGDGATVTRRRHQHRHRARASPCRSSTSACPTRAGACSRRASSRASSGSPSRPARRRPRASPSISDRSRTGTCRRTPGRSRPGATTSRSRGHPATPCWAATSRRAGRAAEVHAAREEAQAREEAPREAAAPPPPPLGVRAVSGGGCW